MLGYEGKCKRRNEHKSERVNKTRGCHLRIRFRCKYKDNNSVCCKYNTLQDTGDVLSRKQRTTFRRNTIWPNKFCSVLDDVQVGPYNNRRKATDFRSRTSVQSRQLIRWTKKMIWEKLRDHLKDHTFPLQCSDTSSHEAGHPNGT
jgi:hypothetical protein